MKERLITDGWTVDAYGAIEYPTENQYTTPPGAYLAEHVSGEVEKIFVHWSILVGAFAFNSRDKVVDLSDYSIIKALKDGGE